jgi:hypothetical protein
MTINIPTKTQTSLFVCRDEIIHDFNAEAKWRETPKKQANDIPAFREN